MRKNELERKLWKTGVFSGKWNPEIAEKVKEILQNYGPPNLQDLNLSMKTFNSLKAADFRDLPQIVEAFIVDGRITYPQKQKPRNFGPKSLKEVKEVLIKYGYLKSVQSMEENNELMSGLWKTGAFLGEWNPEIVEKVREILQSSYKPLTSLQDLNLSTRVYDILRCLDFKTLQQIADEFILNGELVLPQRMHGSSIGPRRLKEIKQVLIDYGYLG